MSSWFIAGTDTGVGKTTLCAAVVTAARKRGLSAAGVKPIESGCSRIDGNVIPNDAEILCRAADFRLSMEEVCLYRFEEAVAPGVAAEEHGVVIDFERVKSVIVQALKRQFDVLMVEGAGGVLVPLGENRTVRDLVKFLGLPVAVVGRAGLGTINHTLLTIEALIRHQVEVGLVVLVATEPVEMSFAASNASEIERVSGIHVGGILPHFDLVSEMDLLGGWVEEHLLDHFC